MITEHVETQFAVYDRVNNLEARDNVPYLSLASVQFICRTCQKRAYVDLTIVPVHAIHIKCGSCDTPLFNIQEEEFEHTLQVIKEEENKC